MQSHPLNILLSAGSPKHALALREALEGERPAPQLQLDVAPGPLEAFDLIQRADYDALLLALSGNEDGCAESLARMRLRKPLPPVIALLSPGDEPPTSAASACGAQDFLTMGRFDGALLMRVIHHAIERRRLQNALRESDERRKALFEHSPEGIALVDPISMTPIEFNDAACEILGYSRQEMAQMRMDEHEDIPPGKRPELYVEDMTPGRRQFFETLFKRKNGERIDASVVMQIMALSGPPLLHVVFQDITRKKSAERGVKLLATAVEQTVEGILITGKDGLIQYANPSYKQISGYDPAELMGRTPGGILRSKPQVGTYKAIQETVCSGKVWRGRFQSRKKNGEPYDTETTISPVRDEDGKIAHYVAVERDISREIDLEKQLRQAQKMEAIGALAGGIAHDFNNILGIIMGYADMLAIEASKNGMPVAEIKQITKATHRAKDLIRQILSFSRKGEQQRMPLQMKVIIKEALKMLRASIPSTIGISEQVESDSVVNADPTQIHQVLMNLCTNAFHAMRKDGGELTVDLADVNVGNNPPHPDLAPGPYVRLSVSDTGCGMSPEIVERIFEPFFTTKEVGDGTGMGLSVVHGIIKSYEGAVTVKSKPGQGSVFTVYIPRVLAKAVEERKDSKRLLRGTERILFVDDEDELARLASRMLQPLGYKLDIQTDSMEALEAFQREPWKFDLVITDQTMPRLTGVELARRMMDIRSDIPIILCSGFSEALTPEKIKDCGVRTFLLKPLSLNLMARAIREVLDNAGKRAPTSPAREDFVQRGQ